MQKIMLDWSEQSLATKRIFVVVLVLKMSIRVGPTRAGGSKWAFAASLTDTNAWLDRNLAFPTITDANLPYEFDRFRASSRWWWWAFKTEGFTATCHPSMPHFSLEPIFSGRWLLAKSWSIWSECPIAHPQGPSLRHKVSTVWFK